MAQAIFGSSIHSIAPPVWPPLGTSGTSPQEYAMSMHTDFSGARAAGQATHRLADIHRHTKRGFNTMGTMNNNSHETHRCFAANNLVCTQDVLRNHGAAASRMIRTTHERQPFTHFPAFQGMKTGRSYSEACLTPVARTPELIPPPHEVIARGSAGVAIRHLLPVAGSQTEAANKKKVINFPALSYNFIADQATPLRPHEKTGFMS